MSSIKFVSILLLTFLIFSTNAQQIRYKNVLNENAVCGLVSGYNGTCQKINDCRKEFDSYKNNQTVLKICKFGKTAKDDIICCPNLQNKPMVDRKNVDESSTPDLLDFATCRETLLKYRKYTFNPFRYFEAMRKKEVPSNNENCEYLDRLNDYAQNFEMIESTFIESGACSLVSDGDNFLEAVSPAFGGYAVLRGNRPNMAAIGWTQKDNSVTFRCGGSLITDRYVVTAAHCKYDNGTQGDTVRIGDRFLITSEDDDIAQQQKILIFIQHPDYTPRYNYDDIAMIKTVGKIFFNQFVVPSCIDDLDSEKIGIFSDWTVAGYGETEDRTPSNVLLELKVDLVSNEKCNNVFEDHSSLPRGIINSQFCVIGRSNGGITTDTCFGDSGSPLQFKTAHEIFTDEYLSYIYDASTVLGVVSFGIDCGLKIPSVYTKLNYYKDWMRSIIADN